MKAKVNKAVDDGEYIIGILLRLLKWISWRKFIGQRTTYYNAGYLFHHQIEHLMITKVLTWYKQTDKKNSQYQ